VLSILLQYGNLTNPNTALAVHDDGIFELDGNALDQAAAGDDWQNGTPGAADSLFIPGSVEKDGVDTTYFAQGGSKDHHDIDEWHYSATDVAPDKDELIDVFAAAYDTADGTTVYYGADKFDDSGDAQIGFWFFQGAVSLGANGLFNGAHTVGDVLVLSDFTNGGSVDLICVYEWNPPGDDIAAGVPTNTGCDLGDNLTLAAAGAECDVSGPDGSFNVCAIVNPGVETAPWPFVNKDGATDFGVGQFFEGGINLDDLFDGDAPCFSGFLAETRSSQEVEAQLKDFALGNLNTCKPPDIETQVSDSVIDVGESVTDTADLTNNSPLPTGSIAFYLCGPEASAPDCSTGGALISTETLVAGMATSDPFTADSVDDAGFYCFRAEYAPDAQGELNYVAGSHTNLTSECFEVQAAVIDVEKTADAPSVNAGEQIGFTVTISNDGAGLATGLAFLDALPGGDGIDWSIESQSGGFSISGSPQTESLVFAPTTLAGGASAWVHIVSDTTADSCGTYDNTASVTTTNDGEDEASASTEVLCAVIDIDKVADDDSVNAGDQIGFTVTISNSGEGDATGLNFTDDLPGGPGVSWTIESQSGGFSITGTAPDQSIAFATTTLDAGATAWVHVVSNTTADSCGLYDNTASVTTGNDGEDEASDSTTVLCGAINVEKVADDDEVVAGNQIGFTVTITNSGEGDVTGLNFTDDLPDGTGVSWTIESQSGGFSITGSAPNQGLAFAPTTLAAGASASVHIVSDTTTDSCGLYDNTAAVTTGNDGEDEASDSTGVRCPAIDIVKSVNDADHIVGPGQLLTYSLALTVVNGPVTQSVVSDPLPVGQDFVSASDGGVYAAATRTITWNLGTLQTGNPTKILTYQVTVAANAAPGAQPNTATFDTQETGPESDDETVSVPALVIDKSYVGNTGGTAVNGMGIAKVGDTLTYTLAYNVTGGPVTNAVITDTLPNGLAYVVGSALGNAEFTFVNYDAATRTLTWTAPAIPKDKDGSVSYRVTVLDGSFNLPQPLVNTATIDSDQTAKDDDTENVLVQVVLAETATPVVTLPPTDSLDSGEQAPSNPGFGLMLALFVLAGVGLVAGYLTPTPGRTRRQEVRRR
jgi:uncharacterized repeat protein (TIGR01451 family)